MAEAFTIRVSQLERDGALRAGASGELRWARVPFGTTIIRFDVFEAPHGLTISLRYRIADETIDTEISLEADSDATPHWWMICPSPGCGRRVAKLYLPIGRSRFACRNCHGVTNVWVSKEDDF